MNIEASIEAVIFGHGTVISKAKIMEILKLDVEEVNQAIGNIREKYASEDRGIELCEVSGGVQFRTKSEFGHLLRELKRELPKRLTTAALETLAIIAYRQPIVRSDIERIRGVDVTPTIKTLLERDLIKIIGHQQTVGQPALYATTDEFLSIFGLDSLTALPTLRDIAELDSDPGEVEQIDSEVQAAANE